MHFEVKGVWIHSTGDHFNMLLCPPSQKGLLLKERICSSESKFFPLKVAHFIKGSANAGLLKMPSLQKQ